MAVTAVFSDLVEVDLSLDCIFLDPNNPRFVDENWIDIPDERIDNTEIQEHTLQKMLQEFNVEKLKLNMEVNGYLPIDRVIVRGFAQDKYVVLEGNRRISAAKQLQQVIRLGDELPEHVVRSLETIPCLQYTGHDTDASWIFQGLRHITGVAPWSAYNKAKLLVEQMEEEQLSLTEVGQIFGLTAHGAGQWVRGYYAFKQAKERSDYRREVDERAYPYFQELFSRSSIPVREWMEWNDTEYRFENELNFNEFLGWLYPREEPQDERNADDVLGDWEERKLVRRDDIRDVAFLITEAKREFAQFRQELDLERAYARAQARKAEQEVAREVDPVVELLDVIEDCARQLENIPLLRVLRDETTLHELSQRLERLNVAVDSVAEGIT